MRAGDNLWVKGESWCFRSHRDPMVAKKSKNKIRDVDHYFSQLPATAKETLAKLRQTIKSVVPDADEVISYEMPAFKYRGRILVWYAGFREHCSLFPTAAVIDAHQSDLKAYETSKGTIRFPVSKPLPATLVKRLVKTRVKNLLAK
jgi:uncharacterized protein YdhG (YjbR/CyaY superfamily)